MLDGAFDKTPQAATGASQPCLKADSAEAERHRLKQEAQWRRQQYPRRMREKTRCYSADSGHVRKSGAPPLFGIDLTPRAPPPLQGSECCLRQKMERTQ